MNLFRRKPKEPRAIDISDRLASELSWWRHFSSRWECDAQTIGRHMDRADALVDEVRHSEAALREEGT